MKERPILFSGPMIRAILEGRKAQTRRVVKHIPALGLPDDWCQKYANDSSESKAMLGNYRRFCPYGQPGDLLYVKESAWMWCERRPNGATPAGRQKWLYVPMREAPVLYAADHPEKPTVAVVSPDTGNEWGWRFKVGRFLPRWASRITLEITNVRVERLQAISEADAKAEGVERDKYPCDHARQSCDDIGCMGSTFRSSFAELWLNINGSNSWSQNPWVWVIEFKQLREQEKAA